ncbi:MAG: 6-phosphogluconolactonase [Bryobacteraceae bacterium]|nr:6-phosphogluconolactonase [Bryobacteraceae bacterium]MDW8377323.1 6-phosphogluconolactonase [Bryobacterales bacterium]
MGLHRFSYPTAELAAEACARQILLRLEEALSGHGKATLAVSGGASPRPMFTHLAQARFDWRDVHLFWVDERMVPPNHADSNYFHCERLFLTPARFPRHNVHRIQGELKPHRAARKYLEDLGDFFALGPDEAPHFDVIHLGVGADGHVASLFPGETLVLDREGLAAAVYVEKLASWRVTLLPRALLEARHLILLVTGRDKAEALKNVWEAPYDPLRYPAQLVLHHARHQTWFLDQTAAG